MAPSIQDDLLLSWIGQLESAILIAAEELRGGDVAYAARVLLVMEDRIKLAAEELEAAARAADAKRVTRH